MRPQTARERSAGREVGEFRGVVQPMRRATNYERVRHTSLAPGFKMKPLPKSVLARYRRVLGQCTSVREAAQRLGIRSNTLAAAFYRNDERASDFLKAVRPAATLPPPPPETE